MLNISDLEKRWLRYKLKSFFPYFLLLLFIIIAGITYIVFTKTTIKHKPIKQDTNISKKTHIQQKKELNVQPLVAPVNAALPSERKLSPSMDFIQKLDTTMLPDSHQITTKQAHIQKKKTLQKKVQVKKQPHVKKELEVSKITIIKQDTAQDIKNILARFAKDKNPALSLFLAKKYYELQDYKKAAQYALITNRLNKDIEDSWLIFSKSLVKMHQKDKAIQVLQTYIKSSHSTNAAVLLHNIRSGEFQ
jgi:tetratricopeptide (TPR) repeat protein